MLVYAVYGKKEKFGILKFNDWILNKI
jgi:hypothetical protein